MSHIYITEICNLSNTENTVKKKEKKNGITKIENNSTCKNRKKKKNNNFSFNVPFLRKSTR